MSKRCVGVSGSLLLNKNGNEVFCNMPKHCNGLSKQVFCKEQGNPYDGTFHFDDILYAMYNLFQIITLSGWSDMMYVMRDSEQTL